MALASHKQWLHRLAIPSVLLTIMVILWSSTLGVVIYRMLGGTITSVNSRPATFADELLIYGIEGAFYAISLHCLLLLFLFVGRVTFRWWVVAILLLVVGTPVALYSGWKIEDYLRTLNQGGTPWEGLAPQVIGLASAWLLHIPLAIWLSRYRFVVVRGDDQRKSPCPRCGYELYGSSGSCPECGWEIPVGLSSNRPPNQRPQVNGNARDGE